MTQPAPGLGNEYTEAQNPTTQARVQMAVSKAAQDISSEAGSTPNHAQRVQLATRVANSPQMMTQPFTTMVCAQGITATSTDADISNMVAAVWNTMAGQPATP